MIVFPSFDFLIFEKYYSFCKVILTSDSITLYTILQELLFLFCFFAFFFFAFLLFSFFQKLLKNQKEAKTGKEKYATMGID